MVKIGLIFPGQGAQAVGMGKALAEAYPSAKACFEKADAQLGESLSSLCWEGPEETLTRTQYAQVALYVTSMAALSALKAQVQAQGGQLNFQATAGLSLGEYTALAAAGAFTFEEGLKLVQLRGQAMEEAAQQEEGTMASVMGLEVDTVEALCSESGAEVANMNAPGQIVVSGTPETVGVASEKAKEAGAKRVIPLQVGGAFHSRLMQPAADKLRAAVNAVDLQAPSVQVMSNVTGAYYDDMDQIRTLLVDQLTKPVRWEACVRNLIASGVETFLEIGEGSVLKGLVRKIDRDATVHNVGTPEQVEEAVALFVNS